MRKRVTTISVSYTLKDEKHEWLTGIFYNGNLTIEILDADYESIDFLYNLL